MPVFQHPNRRTVMGRPQTMGPSFGERLAKKPVTGARAGVTTTPNVKPTITGWQNYTGKTMGPVGQYSRVPGFGRTFKG